MIFTRKSITKILYLLLSFINGISTNKQEKKEKFESLDKLEFQAKKEQFNVQKEISRLKDFKYETQQQLREIKSANIFLTNRVDNQEERIHILESILQQFKGIGWYTYIVILHISLKFLKSYGRTNELVRLKVSCCKEMTVNRVHHVNV